MPLLADTIVECGRRTLTNAINLANDWGNNTSSKWSGIRVLYGDTDSVFIIVPGRSVEEAFAFGEEFCKAVTDSNPPPVQLKLEKVREDLHNNGETRSGDAKPMCRSNRCCSLRSTLVQ